MRNFALLKIIFTVIIFSVQICSVAANHSINKLVDQNASDSVKAKQQKSITIPEGTRLMVKLEKPINTAQNKAGSVFTALLDLDLVVDGKIIAPKGTKVYGKVIDSRGGKLLGGQKLVFQFTDLLINNQLTPILTEPMGVEAGKGNTAKKVGAGALIGSAFGGSKGAGKGALIAGGLAALTSRGNHIQIPAGTIAEVPLKAPVIIK